jgi:hypothetical protein
MMLFKYTSAEGDQPIYICPDQIVSVSKDTSILNRDDVSGILTVPGNYFKVLGTAEDIAGVIVAQTTASS